MKTRRPSRNALARDVGTRNAPGKSRREQKGQQGAGNGDGKAGQQDVEGRTVPQHGRPVL